MKIGWLADNTPVLGGAELTQQEFRDGAPDGVEIVDCPPHGVVPDLDRYVVHNCVLYVPEDFKPITAPTFKYWHDVGAHLRPEVVGWLDRHARPLCCSPVQADYMGLDNVACVPPPVDLERFRAAAASVNGDREGAVSVAAWRNFGKAPHRVAEWSKNTGEPVAFYGPGTFAPDGSREVPYSQMPKLLAAYDKFVFLPTVLEPFGRLVAEAWAAGCVVVTNKLVGARWWIEENPDALETGNREFWEAVTG